MGAFYRSKHELVFVFKKGVAKHVNNFGLGENGRYRTNVWDYAGISSLGPDRDEQLAMHPTVKPVAMIADAMRDCSRRNGLVLDAFAGSGTVIIAAEETGRRARAIEIDRHYADVAVRRWQLMTGRRAVLEDGGLAFDEASARDQ
jgi:DNA modification methylase